MKDAGLMPAMEALRTFFEKEASRGAEQVILGIPYHFHISVS